MIARVRLVTANFTAEGSMGLVAAANLSARLGFASAELQQRILTKLSQPRTDDLPNDPIAREEAMRFRQGK